MQSHQSLLRMAKMNRRYHEIEDTRKSRRAILARLCRHQFTLKYHPSRPNLPVPLVFQVGPADRDRPHISQHAKGNLATARVGIFCNVANCPAKPTDCICPPHRPGTVDCGCDVSFGAFRTNEFLWLGNVVSVNRSCSARFRD